MRKITRTEEMPDILLFRDQIYMQDGAPGREVASINHHRKKVFSINSSTGVKE